MSVAFSEKSSQQFIHGIPVSSALGEQIQRAVENVQRVRTAELAQGKGRIVETPPNKYIIPEPLAYPG